MADLLSKIGKPFKHGFDELKRVLTTNDFDIPHDTSVPSMGKEAGIVPSVNEGEPIKIVLLDKISSSSGPVEKSLLGGGAYFRSVEKEDGEEFGLTFKATKGLYELAESKENGKAVAICRKDSSGTITIFGFEPLYSDQPPSGIKHDDRTIYAYYQFKEPKDNTYASHRLAIVNEKGESPAYEVHQAGFVGHKNQHIVRLRHKPCALIEDPRGKDSSGSYNITVNPGIDPCLIIFLAALCIKIDAKEEEGNLFERFGREIIA